MGVHLPHYGIEICPHGGWHFGSQWDAPSSMGVAAAWYLDINAMLSITIGCANLSCVVFMPVPAICHVVHATLAWRESWIHAAKEINMVEATTSEMHGYYYWFNHMYVRGHCKEHQEPCSADSKLPIQHTRACNAPTVWRVQMLGNVHTPSKSENQKVIVSSRVGLYCHVLS